MDQGRLTGPLTARCTGQFLQRGAYLSGFSEDSGIGTAIMPHHRTVEFFLCTTAGTPLEVTDAVRPMGHRLQGTEHRHAGLLLFGHRLPVGKAGAGLHHQERLAFQGVEQVMHHGSIQRGLFHRLGSLVPGGIVVPADYIQLSGQVMVVDIVEAVHQVGGKPSLGGQGPHAVPLKFEKVDVAAADKPFPVQQQPLHRILPLGRRALDLFPVGVVMAPEMCVPGLVQRFQAAVPALQPAAELRLAERAVTVAAHLIGDVPQNHRRVFTKTAGQLFIDGTHLFPVDG